MVVIRIHSLSGKNKLPVNQNNTVGIEATEMEEAVFTRKSITARCVRQGRIDLFYQANNLSYEIQKTR